MAQQLHDLNRERRDIESGMQRDAMAQLAEIDVGDAALPFGLCLYDAGFHQGVVGILASRLKERYHRPTIVFADADDGSLKGSGRSIEGVHIRDVLDRVATTHPDLIAKFGGHAMAAGLSLEKADYPRFATAFDAAVKEAVSGEAPEPVTVTDGEVSLVDLTLSVAEDLVAGGPWGQQFPEPLFDGRFRIVSQRVVGEKHLKLILEAGGVQFDAIAFNVVADGWPDQQVTEITAAYRLDINEFRGQRKLQLIVSALCPVPLA